MKLPTMPILDEPSERPGCVPASKDEPFLPSIKPSLTSKPANTTTTVTNTTTTSFSDNQRKDGYTHANASPHDHFKSTFKSYSSAPASESSTPFKLPTIDRSKSNSVSSLVSDSYTHKSRGRSRDRRARLCRSPSCPTSLWNEGQETPDTCRLEEGKELTNSHVRPFLTHRGDDDGIKLPNIFQSRLSSNASLNMSTSTANSSAHNSRDTSPFSFRRESTFLNLSHGSHPHDTPLTLHSPPHSRDEGDNNLSRSGTQSSALLLPIQSGHEVRTSNKTRRKRKKQNGLLNTSDLGADAEKLLREKLGAIERRDYEHSVATSAPEGEKTNLSESAFIDKVKDENNLANGASEPLTSKPPIYQNTPTRITTEKKVASVKA